MEIQYSPELGERYGITEEDFNDMPEETKSVVFVGWVSKPCAICGKAVTVLESHTGETWCMEHRGTWGGNLNV